MSSSNLLGKKVNLAGQVYEVQSQTKVDGTDTIILSRELPMSKPSTIYDLGFSSEDDIFFTDSEMQKCKEELDLKINQTIELASIMPDDTIKLNACIFYGLSTIDSTHAKVSFIDEDQPGKEPNIQIIDFDILIDAVLVAKRFHKITKLRYLSAKAKENQAGLSETKKSPEKGDGLDSYINDLESTLDSVESFNSLDQVDVQRIKEGINKLLKNRSKSNQQELFGEGFDTIFKDMDKIFTTFK